MRLMITALALFSFSLPAFSAQILVREIEPKGGAKKAFAESLTPLLEASLSRVEGMSVISEADIKALLANEANKQMMGCDAQACMTEIANSMGAELLARTTLSKVGKQFLITISLLDVENAKVALKTTGRAKGGVEAIENAVQSLFQRTLPTELKGPGSLSKRGFQAALMGLETKGVNDVEGRAAARKRAVLDIIKTELDFDAKPKMQLLERSVSKSLTQARYASMLAKNPKDFQAKLDTYAFFKAVLNDHGRLKELRARAREKGTPISARALRFAPPESIERFSVSERAEFSTYQKGPRKVVAKALKALKKDDPVAFSKLFLEDKAQLGLTKFKDELKLRKKKISFELLPDHARLPSMNRTVQRNMKDNKECVVFLRRKTNGKVSGDKRVRLKRVNKEWRIQSW